MEQLRQKHLPDIKSGIDTDHFPVIIEANIALKANYRKEQNKTRYLPCLEKQQELLNEALQKTQPTVRNNTNITEWIAQAAAQEMTIKIMTKRQFDISEETDRHPMHSRNTYGRKQKRKGKETCMVLLGGWIWTHDMFTA